MIYGNQPLLNVLPLTTQLTDLTTASAKGVNIGTKYIGGTYGNEYRLFYLSTGTLFPGQGAFMAQSGSTMWNVQASAYASTSQGTDPVMCINDQAQSVASGTYFWGMVMGDVTSAMTVIASTTISTSWYAIPTYVGSSTTGSSGAWNAIAVASANVTTGIVQQGGLFVKASVAAGCAITGYFRGWIQ